MIRINLPISNSMKQRGFTLIELLVVIAIIGILSSVVLASLNSARMKARDARKIADFKQISTVLNFYYDKYGTMPANLVPTTQVCDGGPNQAQYDQLMTSFINDKFLGQIPRSPGGGTYCYYNYGANNSVGALMVTTLEAAPNTTTGISPSCRIAPPGQNWCDQSSNKYYCICNPY